MNKQIILFDGTAFLFRSYFSTTSQSLTNDEGFPTGAIFGVINSIKSLQRKYQEAKIITIFDAKGLNFRHDIYPQYKSNRKPADKELILQIEPLYEIIKALGFHFICVDGVEADDVIATLSKKTQKEKIPTIIASSDKDLFQLVNDNVKQLDMKGRFYDSLAIEEKMGVAPKQIFELLTLSGDSVDNIPGIPGVGIKTATKLLKKYKNIQGIKDNKADIEGKLGEKIRNSIDILKLSAKLVALKFDVNIPINILDKGPEEDKEKLIKLYKKYGFLMWLKQIEDTKNNTKSTKKEILDKQYNNSQILKKYSQHLILQEKDFENLTTKLNKSKSFVIDLETNSLNYMDAKIVAFVFLINKDSYYVPVAHDYLGAPKQLDREKTLTSLKSILENEKIGKIGQNLKYDSHVLTNAGIQLKGIIEDTMLKSYCLNSTISRHNMDDLAKLYLNYKTTSFTDIAGKGKQTLTFNQIEIEQAMPYACEDAIITQELNQHLEDKIKKIDNLYNIYKNLELPLLEVILQIERNGTLINASSLYIQQEQIREKMKNIQQKAFAITSFEFNMDSPKQIQEVLFSEQGMGLEAKKQTPKGQPSTNEEALKALDHPLVDLILSYRTLAKLDSTYLSVLPKQINNKTKRLHTSYHQAVTATGRLSSSNPNLQNIPIRSEEGASIRSAFITKDNNNILAADYSQIELRIMAHLSQDKNLINAFKNNIDIHNTTASQIFDIPIEKLEKEHRRKAKAINFGLIYGMSAFGLAKQINSSRTVAQKYIDAYFANYPGVLEYMKNTREKAKELGFVETINGRRLYLEHINSKNKMLQKQSIRAAINAPMQGSSADIIKQAMLNIHNWIKEEERAIKIIMQVHDELIFEIPIKKNDIAKNKIRLIMENAVKIDIPLTVNIGVADNWQEAR